MRALFTVLLSPLLLVQALWVVSRASVLPEAAGPRSGVAGQGPELRLLILGDSSGAGVGVDTQDQALAGQVVSQLKPRYCVTWNVLAKSGATTSTALKMLDELQGQQFDVAAIALGVNDTKNAVSARKWRRNYAEILRRLTTQHGVRLVCASGLPPMGKMPILPRPLRDVIGARARLFDAILRDVLAAVPQAVHVPLQFDLDASAAAPDGFHPGPEIYRIWAERICEQLDLRLNG